jgi:hypothetical protein
LPALGAPRMATKPDLKRDGVESEGRSVICESSCIS